MTHRNGGDESLRFHPAFICRWEFGLEEPATSGKLRRIRAEKGDSR
jgi:hypothetical protein